jgi:hypothetical protein
MGVVARRYGEGKFGRPNGKAEAQKAESEIFTPYAPAVLSKRKAPVRSRLIGKRILGESGDFRRDFNFERNSWKS